MGKLFVQKHASGGISLIYVASGTTMLIYNTSSMNTAKQILSFLSLRRLNLKNKKKLMLKKFIG
nr:MAG TPA: hypothetical protein [Caudoviricetes sp.]